MSSLLARKGVTYLLVVAVLAGFAIFIGHHEPTRRVTWDFIMPSHDWSSIADSRPYVDLESDLKETKYHGGVAGFSIFSNLYLHDGAYVVVTSEPDSFPSVASIMRGWPDKNDDRPPAGNDWYVVLSPAEARHRLGDIAVRKEGLSMFMNDTPGKDSSFLDHYYHFCTCCVVAQAIVANVRADYHTEMFIGGWRAFTGGFPDPTGKYELPKRIMYRTEPDDWRDRPRLITWLLQVMLPDTAIEDAWLWSDREISQMPYVFDKITISDRWAAHKMGKDPYRFNKSTADLPRITTLDNWMQPFRDRLKHLTTAAHCRIQRKKHDVPIVTYIDRQKGGRKFVNEDAELLLKSMWELHEEGVIEFYDAVMEHIPGVDQMCLAMRTDIMMGIHGNGLTHQMWMKPHSVLIEMMDIGGFTMDYALPAEILGHDYYAIHNDTIFPKSKWLKPNGWGVDQTPGFHGDQIRIHGPYMAELVGGIAKSRKWRDEPPSAS